MGLGVGAVRDVGLVVGVFAEFLQDLVEDPSLVPASEPHMNGLPGSKPFGEVSLRNARLGDVEQGVDKRPVRQADGSTGSPLLSGQQGFEPTPFLVVQFVARHLRA